MEDYYCQSGNNTSSVNYKCCFSIVEKESNPLFQWTK